MSVIPQIQPVSKLAKDHKSVFARLGNGPVVLANRSEAQAVLVSVEEWDKREVELAQLRRIILADQYAQEMDEDPSKEIPFTEEELRKRGLIDA